MRRDAPVDRATDLADGKPGGDGADARLDVGVDNRADAGWPFVPSCVSGRPPSPAIDPMSFAGSVTVGCGAASIPLARVVDTFQQGMVFDATLNPSVSGFGVSFAPDLCAGQNYAEVTLQAIGVPGLRPGDRFGTGLYIAVQGPTMPVLRAPLVISVVATQFTLVEDVIDFGTIPLGTSATRDVQIINSASSAPIPILYVSAPPDALPFYLFNRPATPEGSPLQPGATGPLLTALFNPNNLGLFTTTFRITAFPSGASIDPTCGSISALTVRGQVVQAGLP